MGDAVTAYSPVGPFEIIFLHFDRCYIVLGTWVTLDLFQFWHNNIIDLKLFV